MIELLVNNSTSKHARREINKKMFSLLDMRDYSDNYKVYFVKYINYFILKK